MDFKYTGLTKTNVLYATVSVMNYSSPPRSEGDMNPRGSNGSLKP